MLLAMVMGLHGLYFMNVYYYVNICCNLFLQNDVGECKSTVFFNFFMEIAVFVCD